MGEEPFLWVEVVEHYVGVGGGAGGEDDYFCEGAELAYEFVAMRTHSDACLS